jgi:hypothetical protein
LRISKSEVSRICQGLDEQAEAFRNRPLPVPVAGRALAVAALVGAASSAQKPSFTITPLVEPKGGSDGDLYNASGFGAMTALSWLSPFALVLTSNYLSVICRSE